MKASLVIYPLHAQDRLLSIYSALSAIQTHKERDSVHLI